MTCGHVQSLVVMTNKTYGQCKHKDSQTKELFIDATGLHEMRWRQDWHMLGSRIAFLTDYHRRSVTPLHHVRPLRQLGGALTCPSPVRAQPDCTHHLCHERQQHHCCSTLLLLLTLRLTALPADLDAHLAVDLHRRPDRTPVHLEMQHCLMQLSPSSFASSSP